MVNVARFGYVLSDGHSVRRGQPHGGRLRAGRPVLTVGRRPGALQEFRNDRVQWSDTLSWLRGRHGFKAGVDVLLTHVTYSNAQNFAGRYRFLSLASFGESLAGARPGPGESFLQAFSGFGMPGVTTHPDTDEYAAFIQDEWRVMPTLMLSVGLRYDLQVMGKPPVRNASQELAAAGLDTSFRPIDTRNLAPRLGLAWSPARPQLVARVGLRPVLCANGLRSWPLARIS